MCGDSEVGGVLAHNIHCHNQKWQPPPLGFYKVNFDDAFFPAQGVVGLGVLARESSCNFMGGVLTNDKSFESLAVLHVTIFALDYSLAESSIDLSGCDASPVEEGRFQFVSKEGILQHLRFPAEEAKENGEVESWCKCQSLPPLDQKIAYSRLLLGLGNQMEQQQWMIQKVQWIQLLILLSSYRPTCHQLMKKNLLLHDC
ncbi:hypothetical protein F0562_028021 [Nyssa sinensis]|uniref:RNase H type-1 domain-containing protein n=1 Tax=Nyssa sinensis TaxID=561372 RepID=A0A5J5B5E2_9ASTE|nr:hypothetical protein F0562_028021 [Nyssa sinensis]